MILWFCDFICWKYRLFKKVIVLRFPALAPTCSTTTYPDVLSWPCPQCPLHLGEMPALVWFGLLLVKPARFLGLNSNYSKDHCELLVCHLLWQKLQKSLEWINELIVFELQSNIGGERSNSTLKISCTEEKVPRVNDTLPNLLLPVSACKACSSSVGCSIVMGGHVGWLRNFETARTKRSAKTGLSSNYICLGGSRSIKRGLIYTYRSQHIMNFIIFPSDVFIFASAQSVRGKYFPI